MAVLMPFDQWFAEQILSHEVSLTRYLNRVWPNMSEIPDLRQDIYVRVYESARDSRPASPRAFLFATARNLLTDHIRRSRVVSIELTADAAALDALGAALGAVGLAAFAAVLWRFLPGHSSWGTLGLAVVAWMVTSSMLWVLRKRS